MTFKMIRLMPQYMLLVHGNVSNFDDLVIKDLRPTRRWVWKLRPSETWRRVVWQTAINVLKPLAVSIFMTEYGYGRFLRKVVTKLQNTWEIREGVVNPVNMPRAGRSGARIPGGTRVYLFRNSSRPALRSSQPAIQMVPAFFPGGKSAGAWIWPLISTSCWIQ